tara:strand:+ start:274 stop:918 length:645 start_codon:yes stop_codon:yes gene_type:complete
MQNSFIVSVILPFFNSEKYIGRCLRSLNRQSLSKKNYEIVIVNDHSDDKSLIEVKKFKEKNIKIINNDKNYGLVKSLNIGIRKAKGSLIVRVDSDDWVHEDFLNIMSTFLFINQDLDAVACDYVLTNENEKNIKVENCEKKPIGCGIMFRTQQLLNLGLYNESFKYAEEEALRKIFLKRHSITRIPLNLYRYRQHKNNRSKNFKLVKLYSSKIK